MCAAHIMARTNIAVDEETADLLADEATRENKSLYALTNEALTAVIKICQYGGSLKEVYGSWRWSRILKDTDAIPLPGDFMERLMKKTFVADKDWLLREWFNEGKRIGSYLKMYAEEFEQLIPRVEEVQAFLPVKRVEFERKEHEGTSTLVVRVLGAGNSVESTTCTEQFLLGILAAYPYKILSSKVSEGIIEVKAEQDKRQSR